MGTTTRGKLPLDAALAQVIEHLIHDTARTFGNCEQLIDIVGIEIGDAPSADLAVAAQPLERADRFVERNSAAPMQQVKIEVIGAKAPQAAFAREDRRLRSGVVRIHL